MSDPRVRHAAALAEIDRQIKMPMSSEERE